MLLSFDRCQIPENEDSNWKKDITMIHWNQTHTIWLLHKYGNAKVIQQRKKVIFLPWNEQSFSGIDHNLSATLNVWTAKKANTKG